MFLDKVYITLELGYDSNYQFVSRKLMSKASELYMYNDFLINNRIHMFKKLQFHKIFRCSVQKFLTLL